MFLFLFLLSPSPSYSLTEDTKILVTKWAPRVWLHNQEVFFPSTINFHLANVEARDSKENIQRPAPLYPNSVPRGEYTGDWHLNTQKDIQCVNCFEDFFFGQELNQVPSYAFVTEHNDTC